jgi:hypothetical protein
MTQIPKVALAIVVLCLITSGCMSPLCWEDLYFHKDKWYWPKMSVASKCAWCQRPLQVEYRLQGYCYRESATTKTDGPFKYTWLGPCRLVYVSEAATYDIVFDGPVCSTGAPLTYSWEVESKVNRLMQADLPSCSARCLRASKAAAEKAPREQKQRVITPP